MPAATLTMKCAQKCGSGDKSQQNPRTLNRLKSLQDCLRLVFGKRAFAAHLAGECVLIDAGATREF